MAGSHSIPKSVRVTDSAPAISSAKPSKEVSNDRIGDVSLDYCPKAAISPFLSRNRRLPVAPRKLRHCKMGYLYPSTKTYVYPRALKLEPEPPPVPFLRLQGRWLQQAGFAIGTPVRILVTPGRLVLEVDE